MRRETGKVQPGVGWGGAGVLQSSGEGWIPAPAPGVLPAEFFSRRPLSGLCSTQARPFFGSPSWFPQSPGALPPSPPPTLGRCVPLTC